MSSLPETDPAPRAQRFDDLGRRHADTRPGVGLRGGVPDLLWRRVPKGTFWMGGDPLALRAWAGRSITIEADFWVAAYPVTVVQFQAFVDAGGYDHSEYWTSIGWDWRCRHESSRPTDRVDNHPVQVTWYVAYAFGQWLEGLRRAGRLPVPPETPDAHVIRLPDEAERERVARYPDGRLFPWGNEYRSGFANIDETSYRDRVGPHYLARITPVGIYPPGPLDVYDLGGNASEWCLTTWNEDAYSADNSPDAVTHRVVRGGHYHQGTSFARGASRTWGDPDPDDQYDPSHGFRLVIGPPFKSRTGEAYAEALRWRAAHRTS